MLGRREVAPGVYGLGSETVNWYVVEDDGALTVVDAGIQGFARTLSDDLGAIGHSVEDVRAVVLTHGDADHVGVAPRLQGAGAKVWAHGGEEPALRKPGLKKGDASPRHWLANLWSPGLWRVAADITRSGGGMPVKVSDTRRMEDGDVLDVPGRPRVIHTPGHTDGHCVLLLEDRGVLFVGDALCNHPWMTGGRGITLMPRFMNVDNAAALEALSAFEDVEARLLLAGHGPQWHGSPRAAVANARRHAGEG
jgi:glyoxylase-like metal-dependent hydrolase (beta-lactamase superfamily II)